VSPGHDDQGFWPQEMLRASWQENAVSWQILAIAKQLTLQHVVNCELAWPQLLGNVALETQRDPELQASSAMAR